MKSIYVLLAPVLFIVVLLGGCVVQYNQPPRKVTPAPLYQPLSDEETKKNVQPKPITLDLVGCKSPAHWEWENGKMVCGTPDSVTSYPYWNQPYYGYYPYGYPYMYGRAYYW
jgi:hypothetical protein